MNVAEGLEVEGAPGAKGSEGKSPLVESAAASSVWREAASAGCEHHRLVASTAMVIAVKAVNRLQSQPKETWRTCAFAVPTVPSTKARTPSMKSDNIGSAWRSCR